MNLEKVIAISGKSGLYELVTQTKNGFIAKNLDTNKKTSIAASNNVSLLSNVAIYTSDDEVPLSEVFELIYKKADGGDALPHKSPETELRAYMEEVLPDYDAARVYYSDLKKLFQWYAILLKNDFFVAEEEAEEETAEPAE